jgi:signal transduction histidine kinase
MLLASITSKKSNILQADEAIEETPEWDKRLQNLVDLFSETLGISCFLMLRCDRERNRNIFYPPKTTIEPDKLLNLCYEIVEDYQSLLRQGQLLNFAESDRLLPLFFLQAAQTYKIRSLLLVPLIYQQSYLGEIFLYSCDRDRQWTEKELKLVRSLVDRCAIEIVQSQLDEQIQQQKLQQELLGKINQKLNCELSPKEILADILDLIGQSFQVDRVMIFNLAQQTNQIEQEWCSNERIIPLSTLTSPSLWEESKILTFKNKNKASQFDFHFNELTGSFLHVPIFIRGQFFGSLTLQTQLERRAFTSEEIDTLEYVVQQIAIALYNLQTQETLKQLEDCNKDLEAQKQQSETANRAKSQFLSHMNHELRTPLTGILGFARMLKDEIYGSLNPKQQQYVGAIAASGEHLLSLVNDFLDISKIEADREELFLETVAVEDLCLASLSMVESRAREQSLDLQLEIAPDVDLCKADQRRIKQVLVNLLSNAIKFTEVGSVTLKVQRDGDRLEFSVIDTGIGLKKADQEKLFQPFQQIHNHLSRKHKGTGLGLALSRKLAQLHGGDLTLVSQEGKGSCFTLHLPV